MFTKEQRKKLLEHKWVDILKSSSNATQTWRRIQDQAIRALDDLTLLAKRLPDNEQREIFGNRIRDLLSAILGIDPTLALAEVIHQPNLKYLDHRRTRLAADLAKVASAYIDMCFS